MYDGGQKDIQVTYLSNLTSSGHLTEVWRESKGRLCTIYIDVPRRSEMGVRFSPMWKDELCLIWYVR